MGIVAAVFGLQCLFGISLEGYVFWTAFPKDLFGLDNPAAVYMIIILPLVCLAILALIGGIFALRRKKWVLALAGSIAAVLPFLALVRLATEFAALGLLGQRLSSLSSNQGPSLPGGNLIKCLRK